MHSGVGRYFSQGMLLLGWSGGSVLCQKPAMKAYHEYVLTK